MNADIPKAHVAGSVFRLVVLILSFAILLVACGGEDPAPTDSPSGPGDPAQPQQETPQDPEGAPTSLDQDAIQALWQGSKHAATYVLDESNANSSCARCHAPVNWLPSMDDMPESCLACKFEVDPPPPIIPENEWTHIECKVCHEYKKDDLQPEAVWLEIAAIDEYADVASVSELCNKCHQAELIDSHVSIEVGGDHAGYGCNDCHDPHSTQASCGSEECHPVVMDGSDAIAGHDEDHARVTCIACHDAAGMQISLDETSIIWITYLAGSERSFISHITQVTVDCARCHFTDNPWELSVEVGQ